MSKPVALFFVTWFTLHSFFKAVENIGVFIVRRRAAGRKEPSK